MYNMMEQKTTLDFFKMVDENVKRITDDKEKIHL